MRPGAGRSLNAARHGIRRMTHAAERWRYFSAMVEPLLIDGRRAWLKQYGDTHNRRTVLRLLDRVATGLDMAALKPPPHHVGEQARQTEARRLDELRRQHVRVPQVLGQGRHSLILEDLGPSLASHLRDAANDAERVDRLVGAAIEAIRRVHAQGAYLGQPVPRNITFDGRDVGFIDFEEDPLEVMELPHAQARDWLMFAYGTARYYDERPLRFTEVLREGLLMEASGVNAQVHHVAGRLQGLARVSRRLGRSARALAHAIFVMHAATSFSLLFGIVLLMDWISDGDLDLLTALV